MAEQATRPSDGAAAPRARRLTADARKKSILAAARRAFSETGDVKGTTIRAIAERGGISEGVIYRHFESKEQLFYEAVVEPLREAVDDLVVAADDIDREQPLTPERQLETMKGLYRQLISTLDKVLPLLGLVLFGDPRIAQRFYREDFSVAMDRLAEAWGEVEGRYGLEPEPLDVSARAVMGIALSFALEEHYNPTFNRDRALQLATAMSVKAFFHPIEPSRRRR